MIQSNETRPRPGFTLIELLVVIAIISVLIALILPAVQAAREAARRAHCVNNLKQIALATQNYHDVNLTFPSQVGYYPAWNSPQDTRVGWLLQTLPFLEQQSLYTAYNFTSGERSEYSPGNSTVIGTQLNVFRCPTYPNAMLLQGQSDWRTLGAPFDAWKIAGTCYKGNLGDNSTGPVPGQPNSFGDVSGSAPTARGIFWRATLVVSIASVTDGTSATFLAGEALPDYCKWNAWSESNDSVAVTSIPLNQEISDDPNDPGYCYGFSSKHPGGVNFAFVDGSVRFFKETASPRIYRGLSTRAGGEILTGDSF